MKKIMILGASILQLPAIKKAKEMGLEVVVVDMNPDAVGFQTEGIEKENPEATAISKRLINGIDFETKSGTIHDMTEAAARTYFEAMKKRYYVN